MNIIHTIPNKYKKIYIINKDVYKKDLTRIINNCDREITVLDND